MKIFLTLLIILTSCFNITQAQPVITGQLGFTQRMDRGHTGSNIGLGVSILSKNNWRLGFSSGISHLTGYGNFENPKNLDYNITNIERKNPYPFEFHEYLLQRGVIIKLAKPEVTQIFSANMVLTRFQDVDKSGFLGTVTAGVSYVNLVEVEHLIEVDSIFETGRGVVAEQALIVLYRYERFIDIPIGLSGGYRWKLNRFLVINVLGNISWMPFSNIATASLNVSIDIGN